MNKAEYFILKIQSIEQKVNYLKSIDNWRKAIEVSTLSKNVDLLTNIKF